MRRMEPKKEVNTNAPLYEVLEPDFRIDDDKEQWNSYESVFVLDFDEDGNLSVDVKKDGTVSADTLIKSLLQADRYNEIRTYAVDNDTTFVPVKNFQVVYGIQKTVRTLPMQIITPVIIIWLHPAGEMQRILLHFW